MKSYKIIEVSSEFSKESLVSLACAVESESKSLACAKK
jgi:hypothetical protein